MNSIRSVSRWLPVIVSMLFIISLARIGVAATHKPVTRPNILLILADDMGYSDLGCYGSEIATPNLDALARNGLRFTQFYNTARCWPSRAGLLTGYYAQQVRRDTVPGVPSGGQGVRPAWARLLPEMLRPLGYRSYHSGKWHLDGKPLENGFDHSYRLEDHDRHFAPKLHFEDDKPLPPATPDSGYYTTQAIADHAIQYLKEHAERYAEQPFFSYLAFTAPHFPLQAPAEDIARYRDTYLRGWDVMREERWKRMRALGIVPGTLSAMEREVGPPYAFPDAIKQLGANEVNRPLLWKELSPTQQAFQASKMAIHAAMVDRMDHEIGRVLAQLRANGTLDNTLVLFLSDNGASAEMMVRGDGHNPNVAAGSDGTFLSLGPGWSSLANTPFRRHKTWVHEGGIATSLIVHWPRGISARGEWRYTPGHVIDMVPTLLAVAGGKPFRSWQGQKVPPAPGHNLTPVFVQDTASRQAPLWWQHEDNRALRAGDWKIVAAGKDAPWELYDLRTDRTETRNLAASDPAKVRELSTRWTRMTEAFGRLARKDLLPQKPSDRKGGAMPWNMKELSRPPKSSPAPDYQEKGVRALFYDGPLYKGKPTRIFAWYGVPEGLKPGEKVPAMVLVHGGGGTAFAEWVRLWTKRGYAAIAMDTCGVAPGKDPNARPRHAEGGPPGWGDFDNVDAPITDQWTYHAVAAIILGHSLLRAQPEVDADRIGITGISWGGYLTCIAAGVDSRFRFAVPVYGCGFLGDNSAWLPDFARLGQERAARWLALWDPSSYLSHAKMPFLWVNGTNDFAYPMDSWQKSYRLTKGTHTLSLQIRMPHGHGGAGENPEEIHAFANAILKKGKAFPRFVLQALEGGTLRVKFDTKQPLQRAELCFTRDTGAWQQRNWESTPAELKSDGTVLAAIPTKATVFYINVRDAEGLIWSAPHLER